MAGNEIGVPPAASELEISVIGPGFGEAILAHIGGGRWILVDSCIVPGSEEPPSLEYLQRLGVDYAEAVESIIVTHWDQDHVRGIDSVVGACPNSSVVFSGALRSEEFFGLADEHNNSPLTSNGLEAIARVARILMERKRSGIRFNTVKWASANKRLLHEDVFLEATSVSAELWALSPAEAVLTQAKLALAEQVLKEVQERKHVRTRVGYPSRNNCSVALWLKVGTHDILLGADLETSRQRNAGWTAVLDDSTAFGNSQADLFKIPHHGSANAHDDRVWQELLTENPYAVVTPWHVGGGVLPRRRDINRILSLTPHAYITSRTRRKQSNFIDRAIRRTVAESTSAVYSRAGRWGHVRLRRAILDPSSSWAVELFGDAQLLVTGSS